MMADISTEGPDQVLPSSDYYTTHISHPVKLRSGETDAARIPPQSVPSFFAEACRRYSTQPALAYKRTPGQEGFEIITYGEYNNLVRVVAKAFLKLGLEKYHCVSVLGFNSPEWFLAYLGAIHAGAVGSGIYVTNSAEATFYCLEQSKSQIAVVEDQAQLDKVLKHKDKLPNLKVIVQYSGTPTTPDVLSWDALLELGRAESDAMLNTALTTIAVNQCCTMIYTSGTTGSPKGVMMSHDNLVWDAKTITSIHDTSDDESVISYLPLSHIAALILDLYVTCHIGVCVYFANKDALKGGLLKTLLEVRPTRFLGVPRVWEKMAEKIKAVGAQSGGVKKAIATWAKTQGLQRNLDLSKGVDNPGFGYLIARTFIFSKVKQNLGLDRCRTFWTGAAPLAQDIKHYFASLDIPIMEAFGMSELSGVHTINVQSAFRFDSIGRTLPGAKTKVESPDANQEGEICVFGRNVFMGYYENKEQTMQTLDSDSWLHTGDVGKLDNEGFVYITGRCKDILITAGGENVAPVLIEQNLQAELPFLGQAIVIGDRKKFLSVLLTLSCEVHGDTGESTKDLADVTKTWLKGLGFNFTTVTEVLQSGPDPKILQSIQSGVDAANSKAISNAQRVQKFVILPVDFSIPCGELGPTMKIKRPVVYEKYKTYIDKLYEE